MKPNNYFSLAIIALMMVFAVGCTTLQESAGSYEEMPSNGRVYRQMPYGSNQVIVLERDPYTGQYFQVSPFGYYGTPYSTFGYGYPTNGYGYPAYPRGGYYRGGSGGGSRPAPQVQPQRRGSETTDRAKDIIRGN